MIYLSPRRPLRTAPPEIILKELLDAKEYLAHMREAKFAPYDYAPGGH